MPRTKSRWRKVLILIGILMILLGMTIISLPLWFPWLARPVARSLGFEFEEYRRLGSGRFEVSGVTGRVTNVEIQIDRVEALLPHSWLWKRWRTDADAGEYLVADNWVVRIHPPQETGREEPRVQSTFEVLNDIDPIARALRTWIPTARLQNGTIHIRDFSVAVPEAEWRAGQLEADVWAKEFPETLSLRVDATRQGRWEIGADGVVPGLKTAAELVREPTHWDVDGAIQWESNRVDIAARFDESGWLPSQADFSGENLMIPPALHNVPHYGPVRGAIGLQWQSGRYTLAARGQAEPVPDISNPIWPRLEFALKGNGDLHGSVIESFEVRAPWFDLRLLTSTRVGHSGPALVEPAMFELNADLNGVSPVCAGMVHAEIEVRPAAGKYPTATMRLRSVEWSAAGFHAKDLEARGSFDWPLAELEIVRMSLGDDMSAQGRGVLDVQALEVQTAAIELHGEDLRPFLPDTIGGDGFRVRIEAAGPVGRLVHQGDMQLDRLTVPELNPMTVSLRWQGEGISSATYAAHAEAGDSRLLLEGRITRWDSAAVSLESRLEGLTLQRNGLTVYQLDKPAHLHWQAAGTNRWQLQLDEFAWRNARDELLILSGGVRWPTAGHVNVVTHHVAIADARDFWPDAALPLTLSSLSLAAGWTNGPLHWELEAAARTDLPEYQTLEIGIRARGDGSGTTVEMVNAGGWEAPPLTGEGILPLVVDVTSDDLVRLLPDAPLEFRVSHEPVEAVEVNLGEGREIQLSHPALELRISGTVSRPRGELRASVAGVGWRSREDTSALPRLEHANLEVELLPGLIQLTQLDFELDGQLVKVYGELPLTGDAALADMNSTAPDWQAASGRVVVENAELGPIAQHFPTLLTSQGRMDLDLSIRPGMVMDGFVSLTNAMTRPLGPLAPVREIDAVIAFSGRTARVERFSGRLGGRPIHAHGQATLTDARELLYSVRVQGTNAPLVRKPGLLMRADLDLSLENQAGEVPTVRGKVQLRDSLLLQDVSALLVDRLERPALRPPYFSVTNLPFAQWRLNVEVSGDRFLRLRSPAFIGEVSANGVVQGSLSEPVINADVRLPRGRILFPFGKLEVEGAYVTLSGAEPAGPLIDLVAAGQNYNYNVRLEVTGTMDNLNVLFTSTPPLSSEDILLMLTAGELPNQEITYSAEARAGRLITYLGREVATRFFGNEMGEERLIVNSGENIARSGRTTYSIEYRLTPRWSLVGEYDEFNALNAGLKWRIYSR